MRIRKGFERFLPAFVLVFFFGGAAFAATSEFSQVINAGTLSADILDSNRDPVASPSVTMSEQNFSFDCQAGGSASTGTFGTASERIYVTNGSSAQNGWNLAVAATDGATALWENSGSDSFIDFNDPTGSTAGCDDGGDADSVAGQMTVDPDAGTITTDCETCGATGISKGSSAAFSEGSVDSINLIAAGGTADVVWRGYIAGIDISQTIPAETPADTYTIDLTLTATAI